MEITKSPYFERKEEKYLKKLTLKQKSQYFERLGIFTTRYPHPEAQRELKIHILSGDKNGKYAFTCLHDKDRSDRIIFSHAGEVFRIEDIEIELHDIGTHDEVYG